MKTQQTVTILKSLADETRLSIVQQLVRDGCEVSSGEIVNSRSTALDLSQPTISHHFAKLVQAGVLTERKTGTEKHYTLNIKLLHSAGIDPHKL